MALDAKALRIEGIYQQNQEGDLMMRVKLAGGLLSVIQASTLAGLGRRFGNGVFHLTTRGSLEFHDLREQDVPIIQREMAAVGLFSRGACGGAVRGISCSAGFGIGFAYTQQLARRLLLYFSGNPHFEGLPKKFKIAVEADYSGSRHLIQDLALVYVGHNGKEALYDVWTGGGLGRMPQAAVLYQKSIAESRILKLAEAIIRVYVKNVAPPKRLKSLIATEGENHFRRLVDEALSHLPDVALTDACEKVLLPEAAEVAQFKLRVPIFAGELSTERLGALTQIADNAGICFVQVTTDQDIALFPADPSQRDLLARELEKAGFDGIDHPAPVLRVCPGNHECSMGLSATRDLAKLLSQRFGHRLNHFCLAVSGCSNSCAQPQLADVGIISSKLVKDESGARCPRYDVYQRLKEESLGEKVAEQLDEGQVLSWLDSRLPEAK